MKKNFFALPFRVELSIIDTIFFSIGSAMANGFIA